MPSRWDPFSCVGAEGRQEGPTASDLWRHARRLAPLLAFALALRVLCFSGFVLGDDPSYARSVREILDGGYPAMDVNPLAARPVFLGALALGVRAGGWTEAAFVSPVLIASLIGLMAAYGLGLAAAGARAGVIAGLAVAVFPLDVVLSTTVANDVVGGALLACGLMCANAPPRARHSSSFGNGRALIGGILMAASIAAKASFLLISIPVLLVTSMLECLCGRVKWCGTTLLGFGLGLSLFAIWAWHVTGDPLAPIHAELAFNRRFMLASYLENRGEALLAYPRWMFLVQRPGPYLHPLSPYGLFFPVAFAASLYAAGSRPRRLIVPLVWLTCAFLTLEFAPLQWWPLYVPLHRLPRFLEALAVPGAVVTGGAASALWLRGPGWRAALVVSGCIVALVNTATAVAMARHNQDALRDPRQAWTLAVSFQGPVFADSELIDYFEFRSGETGASRFHRLHDASDSVSTGALVMLGGSRRPELDPSWVRAFIPPQIPAEWLLLAVLPGTPEPWRVVSGNVYLTRPAQAALPGEVRVPQLVQACPGDQAQRHKAHGQARWELVDVVDVGNPASEAVHSYVVRSGSWSGRRMKLDDAGTTQPHFLEDDGRAFTGVQSFRISGVHPGETLCVAKRLDPGVAHQHSAWFADAVPIGTMAAGGGDASRWEIAALVVEAPKVNQSTVTLAERFVASSLDVNAFRIEVYQRRPTDDRSVGGTSRRSEHASAH